MARPRANITERTKGKRAGETGETGERSGMEHTAGERVRCELCVRVRVC
jgi:hypothetical protein